MVDCHLFSKVFEVMNIYFCIWNFPIFHLTFINISGSRLPELWAAWWPA